MNPPPFCPILMVALAGGVLAFNTYGTRAERCAWLVSLATLAAGVIWLVLAR